MRATYRIVEHTADVALEASAADLPGLFDRCAAGMVELLVDAVATDSGTSDTGAPPLVIAVEAHDLPELLVGWLRELLWLVNDRGWLYAGAAFAALGEGEPPVLRAEVRGAVARDGRLVREIKAVTYHDLVVERRAGGWFARVVFDV